MATNKTAHELDIPDFLLRSKNDSGEPPPSPLLLRTTQQIPKRKSFDVPMGMTEEEYIAVKTKLETPQKELVMAKRWKVIPYDANGEIIQRGVTSVEEGTDQVQLVAKLAHAFHRCAKGSVKRIVVHDTAEAVIRQWEAGVDSPLPEPEEPRPRTTTTESKPAGRKGKKAKVNDKPVKAKRLRQGGQPGVLATIAEILESKAGGSIDEMVVVLAKRFPDRDPNAMRTTAKIQVKRQGAEKKQDNKRGTVWYK